MYLFFVQDTVLRVSPGVCLCCCSDCYAATQKLLNNVNSVFWLEIYIFFFCFQTRMSSFLCFLVVLLQHYRLLCSFLFWLGNYPSFSSKAECLPSHLLLSWAPVPQTSSECEIRELLHESRQRHSKEQEQKWTFKGCVLWRCQQIGCIQKRNKNFLKLLFMLSLALAEDLAL